MQHYGYTPNQYGVRKSKFSSPFKMKVRIPGSLKKWLSILLGIVVAIILVGYWMLGDLRFFANHVWGFGFFSKHYLVLLQNNYELRPTGGFITAYGELDVFMGIPTRLEFKNSYDIDTQTYVTPPKEQEEMLKSEWYEGYTFRDANWEPDFRNSAPEIVKFYQMKYPEKPVNGVVVVNFSLIEDLLNRLGGVEVNGKELNGGNVFSQLEFEVNNIDRHDVKALKTRKDVLGELAKGLLAKAKRHPLVLRRLIEAGLSNKDIFVWSEDSDLEELLVEKGWAGAMVLPDRSDFLHVNLANLGAKKADRYLDKEIHYYANIRKEVPEMGVEVTLRYPGFLNTYSDNYKGYLRLYLPKTASVDASPVDSTVSVEGDWKVIGTKVILPAGSKVSLMYQYTLPRSTFLPGEFRLRVAKQPGSDPLYDIVVEAAEGNHVSGERFRSLENRAMFEGHLESDANFLLSLTPDLLPPYPIEQQFDELNKIRIIWNKPIDASVAEDASNYSIIDMDKNGPATDAVTVKAVSMPSPNEVVLETEGITKQELEQYQITVRNQKDQAGDVIIPNPKIITVVQRFKPIAAPDIHLGTVPAPAETPPR